MNALAAFQRELMVQNTWCVLRRMALSGALGGFFVWKLLSDSGALLAGSLLGLLAVVISLSVNTYRIVVSRRLFHETKAEIRELKVREYTYRVLEFHHLDGTVLTYRVNERQLERARAIAAQAGIVFPG